MLEEKPRDHFVQINAKVLLSERELLNSKARGAQMNTSQFVRKLIADANVHVHLDIAGQLRELNAWANRINSNLNMLAKIGNIFKDQTDADLIIHNLTLIRESVMGTLDAGKIGGENLVLKHRKRRKPKSQRRKDAGVPT